MSHWRRLAIKTGVVAVVAMAMVASGLFAAAANNGANHRVDLGTVSMSPSSVTLTPQIDYAHARLTVAGQDGVVFTKTFAPGGAISYNLVNSQGKPLADGDYHFELLFLYERAAADDTTAARPPAGQHGPLSLRGDFKVSGGALVPIQGSGREGGPAVPTIGGLQNMSQPEMTLAGVGPVSKKAPDMTSVSEAAAGTFNPSVVISDTSMPFLGLYQSTIPYEWFVYTDSSSSFKVQGKASASVYSNPLQIAAGAPTNSLYIASTGAIGMGTSTPAQALHVVSAKNSVIRLENTNTSVTWDMGVNGTDDFIFTLVSNGSGGTTGQILTIDNGSESDTSLPPRVGIYAPNPDATLEVAGTTSNILHVTSANSGGNVGIIDGGALQVVRSDGLSSNIRFTAGSGTTKSWLFQNNPSNYTFGIRDETANNSPVLIYGGGTGATLTVRNGRVGIRTTNPAGTLDVNGSIYLRGSVLHADYVFDPGFKLESIADHAKYMWKHKHLPAIEGMKKDAEGREIVNLGGQQRGIVQELEEAHIYIYKLNQKDAQLSKDLAATRDELMQLKKELKQLQERLPER